ncbi:hypothetical protein COY32_04630 [candidate division WWE3 bacterium CG_4_10_14_0_2_um_filter_41_14]|uniref:phosphoserine phosphatase n=1 Tax=candidate division WWE3 bacterium CG_4_10_14_0_2_um_filter_41_14 TaxID=1975072 RepID=A0A2M7THK9_UNCKA|nr:MAG: hypothetical protein COY32_04630 [candidate division WWE3 bacterium CG_4_10_14_0_2_um_filter_41_14]
MQIQNIIIDFDSTISGVEVLEEIGRISLEGQEDKDRVLAEIERITNLGMTGVLSFEESLTQRLSMFTINERVIQRAIQSVSSQISPSFVAQLKLLNQYKWFVVSGGFLNIIVPVLENIDVYSQCIRANTLLFKNGICVGVDSNNPLAHSNGKVEVVRSLALEGATVMIGDGSTDLAVKTAGACRYFWYYQEFVDREVVRMQADKVLKDFNDIAVLLN